MSVALPDTEDVTQWDVVQWTIAQGQFLNATQMSMLYYLSLNAFYSSDNPEGEPVGVTLYSASNYRAISEGTGIRSKDTIRLTLNMLQELGFLIRERRDGKAAEQAPLRIRVFWGESFDEYREALRQGQSEIHPKFLIRPKREPKVADVVPLRAVDVTTG